MIKTFFLFNVGKDTYFFRIFAPQKRNSAKKSQQMGQTLGFDYKNVKIMYKIFSFLLVWLLGCIVAGCQNEGGTDGEGSDADSLQDAVEMPGMVTTDVSMLVSDSGVIRYHAISPIWYRYDQDPVKKYWYFPEGIELQQLDDDMQPAGNIMADTAYYQEREQLWHLIHNVRISNVQGERFNTEELYWDGRKQTIYSDSFIHIERHHDILEGYGFTSDQSFTKYEIRRTTGIFEIRAQGEQADFEGDAPDDGEHLAENDEPGTISPTADTVPARPLTPKEKAEAARRRRNNTPQLLKFKDVMNQ